MTTPSKDFRRWLSFQNTPRHWDQWERGIVERLVRKAFEAGRKYERPVIVPANVMSSPKSPSVPAVAGGGEDAARLDWFASRPANAWRLTKMYGPDSGGSGWTGKQFRAVADKFMTIDAAIAATKAKEGNHE